MPETSLTQTWSEAGSDPFEAYERYLVPALFAPWAEDLVELVDLRPGQDVLDVACGTGIVARLTSPRVAPTGRVTGVDLLPGMLAVARAVTAGVEPPIEWRESDAAALPLPDESVDVALCQQGLQFFEDRTAALAEMHRVLRPEGRLAVSVFASIDRLPGYHALATVVERHLGPEPAGYFRTIGSLGEATELGDLVTAAGFGELAVSTETLELRAASAADFFLQVAMAAPWLGGPFRQLDDDAQQAVVADYVEATRSHAHEDGFAFPMEAHIALARR